MSRRFLSSARGRLAVVGLVAAGVLGTVGFTGLQESLVYYRTPTELGGAAASSSAEERVRLGGLVQPGSVSRESETLRFVLTDGARDVPVTYQGKAPGVFREGQGAIVEGTLDEAGAFRADTVLVKHSNEYVDGSGRPYER